MSATLVYRSEYPPMAEPPRLTITRALVGSFCPLAVASGVLLSLRIGETAMMM